MKYFLFVIGRGREYATGRRELGILTELPQLAVNTKYLEVWSQPMWFYCYVETEILAVDLSLQKYLPSTDRIIIGRG